MTQGMGEIREPMSTSPDDEVELTGGGVNRVVRIGDTVRRPAGRWTPAVHALLRHLAAAGFTGAPAGHGLDSQGREVLGFVPGEVSEECPPDRALAAAGALLRGYHDATAGFVAPPGADWYFPARSPAEVICHGDIAPYNCVFRDGTPVAFIDFDTAHPGPRVWDVAYAAYRFVPLSAHGDVAEQARRLRLFAGAYRLSETGRGALPATARARLGHLVRHMHERAGAGDEAFAAHIASGHDALYRADAAHIARHQEVLRVALTG